MVHSRHQAGSTGDGLGCLQRPPKRTGDDRARLSGSKRSGQGASLILPDLVERHVDVASQRARGVERCPAVADEINEGLGALTVGS